MTLAQAFEPGHERICTPSADGQTFECRDKASGKLEASPVQPTEPIAAPPAAITAAPTPVRSTSKLPNYLLQNPFAARPERDVEPTAEVTRQSTTIEPPAADAQPAMAAAVAEPSAAPATPIKPSTVRSAHDVEAEAAANAKAQQPRAEPASETQSPTAISAAAADEAPALPQNEPLPASAATSPAASLTVSDASAFLALPASDYTLVLASVRDPSALDDLIRAFDTQPGQLYLLKLGMPDGDWYSLCWSNFADLDAARAARASLPANAPIRSGWPRRIDLLQKELAR